MRYPISNEASLILLPQQGSGLHDNGKWTRTAMVLLQKIMCRCCEVSFHVCRSCYRGQVYCGEACRMAGYLRNHREAQRQYRETDKGKYSHLEAERRRRKKSSPKSSVIMKVLQTCAGLAKTIQLLLAGSKGTEGSAAHCEICGIGGASVNAFPGRGYGRADHGSLPVWSPRIKQVEDQDPENIQFGPTGLKHAT